MGKMRDDGLSLLDITKHAVKTVIGMLGPEDRFSLVAFSSDAQITYPLQHMTPMSRVGAVSAVEALENRGATNIMKGLHEGMEALRAGDIGDGRMKSLLLLTDGVPNRLPERGHVEELRIYKDKHPGFNVQINTFGFGYTLDSDLLLSIAQEGQGTYAFIPDALIVGTAFVNCIANVKSSWRQSANLHLLAENGASFAGPVLGHHAVTEAPWGRVVQLGPLPLGQTIEVVVPMAVPMGGETPYLEAVLEYSNNSTSNSEPCRVSAMGGSRKASASAVLAEMRCGAVSAGYDAVKEASTAGPQGPTRKIAAIAAACRAGLEKMGKGPVVRDHRIVQQLAVAEALCKDVEGRITKALDGQERFQRWGCHYLRAIVRAHQLQLCTNFMDPGLQLYGGDAFRALCDEGGVVFQALPPPQLH